MRRAVVIGFAVLGVACGGKQKLYVVNDTGQPLEIAIDGDKREQPAGEFTTYSQVKLTKGAHLAATLRGAPHDSVTLPPIPDDEYVVWVVRGSDNIHLADYRALYTVGRKEVNLYPPSSSEIAIVDPPSRWMQVDGRASIVGPSSPLPPRGKVTLGGEKLPILRAERVPEGTTDIPKFLAGKAGAELRSSPK